MRHLSVVTSASFCFANILLTNFLLQTAVQVLPRASAIRVVYTTTFLLRPSRANFNPCPTSDAEALPMQPVRCLLTPPLRSAISSSFTDSCQSFFSAFPIHFTDRSGTYPFSFSVALFKTARSLSYPSPFYTSDGGFPYICRLPINHSPWLSLPHFYSCSSADAARGLKSCFHAVEGSLAWVKASGSGLLLFPSRLSHTTADRMYFKQPSRLYKPSTVAAVFVPSFFCKSNTLHARCSFGSPAAASTVSAPASAAGGLSFRNVSQAFVASKDFLNAEVYSPVTRGFPTLKYRMTGAPGAIQVTTAVVPPAGRKLQPAPQAARCALEMSSATAEGKDFLSYKAATNTQCCIICRPGFFAVRQGVLPVSRYASFPAIVSASSALLYSADQGQKGRNSPSAALPMLFLLSPFRRPPPRPPSLLPSTTAAAPRLSNRRFAGAIAAATPVHPLCSSLSTIPSGTSPLKGTSLDLDISFDRGPTLRDCSPPRPDFSAVRPARYCVTTCAALAGFAAADAPAAALTAWGCTRSSLPALSSTKGTARALETASTDCCSAAISNAARTPQPMVCMYDPYSAVTQELLRLLSSSSLRFPGVSNGRQQQAKKQEDLSSLGHEEQQRQGEQQPASVIVFPTTVALPSLLPSSLRSLCSAASPFPFGLPFFFIQHQLQPCTGASTREKKPHHQQQLPHQPLDTELHEPSSYNQQHQQQQQQQQQQPQQQQQQFVWEFPLQQQQLLLHEPLRQQQQEASVSPQQQRFPVAESGGRAAAAALPVQRVVARALVAEATAEGLEHGRSSFFILDTATGQSPSALPIVYTPLLTPPSFPAGHTLQPQKIALLFAALQPFSASALPPASAAASPPVTSATLAAATLHPAVLDADTAASPSCCPALRSSATSADTATAAAISAPRAPTYSSARPTLATGAPAVVSPPCAALPLSSSSFLDLSPRSSSSPSCAASTLPPLPAANGSSCCLSAAAAIPPSPSAAPPSPSAAPPSPSAAASSSCAAASSSRAAASFPAAAAASSSSAVASGCCAAVSSRVGPQVRARFTLFSPVVDEQLIQQWLYHAHAAAYINSAAAGRLSLQQQRKIGVPVSPGFLRKALAEVSCTVLASALAAEVGLACVVGGGTHHAKYEEGGKYCLFNDVAVAAALALQQGRARKVLVLDLDVHQGDGTANIFKDDSRVTTVSVHCEDNFPFHKEVSDVDVSLPSGVGDAAYLHLLDKLIPRLLREEQPSLLFYIAGVDVHASDSLGNLLLTDEGLQRRDALVLQHCLDYNQQIAAALHCNSSSSSNREVGSNFVDSSRVAVCCVIGGGYSKNIKEVVHRHTITFNVASDFWSTKNFAGVYASAANSQLFPDLQHGRPCNQ